MNATVILGFSIGVVVSMLKNAGIISLIIEIAVANDGRM